MNVFIGCFFAFLIGGAICLIGQILIDYTKLTPARILTAFVVTGVILTAVGLYAPIVKLAGAGATVPLTGFGFALAKGVEEAVDRDGLLGALTGGLSATAAGISLVLLLGSISSLLFKSDEK
ncbi:MAG: stage V sporulation protein AE [Clostridia bacterium]|nr:stage V sporulation protein AE [Clostridia bacterium]